MAASGAPAAPRGPAGAAVAVAVEGDEPWALSSPSFSIASFLDAHVGRDVGRAGEVDTEDAVAAALARAAQLAKATSAAADKGEAEADALLTGLPATVADLERRTADVHATLDTLEASLAGLAGTTRATAEENAELARRMTRLSRHLQDLTAVQRYLSVASQMFKLSEEAKALCESTAAMSRASSGGGRVHAAAGHDVSGAGAGESAAAAAGHAGDAATLLSAVAPFTQLVSLHSASAPLIDGTTVDSVMRERIAYLSGALRKHVSMGLSAALEGINWPIVKASALNTDKTARQQFQRAFVQLVQLELSVGPDGTHPQGDAAVTSGSGGGAERDTPPRAAAPLWAIMVMARPLVLRFRYHFTQKGATNKSSKPEWFFVFVVDAIRAHAAFLRTVVQPLVVRAGARNVDALAQFIHCLVGAVQDKVRSLLQRKDMARNQNKLCHLIDEMLLFEKSLQDDFAYCVGGLLPGELSYARAIDVLTGSDDALARWIEVDKRMALERLAAAMNETDAWLCPYDSLTDLIPRRGRTSAHVEHRDGNADSGDGAAGGQDGGDAGASGGGGAAAAAGSGRDLDAAGVAAVVRGQERHRTAGGPQHATVDEVVASMAPPTPADDAALMAGSAGMLRPSTSAEALVAVLHAVTDRYRLLPDAGVQVQFVDHIQRPLLAEYLYNIDDFASRCELLGDPSVGKAWPLFLSLVNTCHYLSTVLSDWGDDAFFLELARLAHEREAGGGAASDRGAGVASLVAQLADKAKLGVGAVGSVTSGVATALTSEDTIIGPGATLRALKGALDDSGVLATAGSLLSGVLGRRRERDYDDSDSDDDTRRVEGGGGGGAGDGGGANGAAGSADALGRKPSLLESIVRESLSGVSAAARSGLATIGEGVGGGGDGVSDPAEYMASDEQAWLTAEGAMFAREVHVLRRLGEDMTRQAAMVAAGKFFSAASAYASRGRMWSAAMAESMRVAQDVSSELCDALVVLRSHLVEVKRLLVADHFAAFWRTLAAQVQTFLCDVVLQDHLVSLAGARQLRFDVDTIIEVFGLCTEGPALHFPLALESVALLVKPESKLVTVLQTMAAQFSGGAGWRHAPPEDAGWALARNVAMGGLGVVHLPPRRVMELISQRIELGDFEW